MPTTGLEPVRHFWHWSLKPACLPIPARGRGTNYGYDRPPTRIGPGQCSRRDSNPHGVNPHRVLNPARLPIPPPERCSSHHDGAEGNRTPDLLNAIQALSQLSYGPLTRPAKPGPRGRSDFDLSINCLRPAGLTRLELATSGVTDRHSNRLSYSPSPHLQLQS
jgi:hypothetical protein